MRVPPTSDTIRVIAAGGIWICRSRTPRGQIKNLSQSTRLLSPLKRCNLFASRAHDSPAWYLHRSRSSPLDRIKFPSVNSLRSIKKLLYTKRRLNRLSFAEGNRSNLAFIRQMIITNKPFLSNDNNHRWFFIFIIILIVLDDSIEVS